MSTKSTQQRGFMMIEALIAMTLIFTAATGTLWFLNRALRTTALQRSQLEAKCEHPTCSSDHNISECRCGTQSFITAR